MLVRKLRRFIISLKRLTNLVGSRFPRSRFITTWTWCASSMPTLSTKASQSGELVDSRARGTRIYLTRDLIVRILGCNNTSPVIDLKKGFIAPNKKWDPSHTMSWFSLKYQPFRFSRKETMVASVFDTLHHLIIYMMAHNVISKKTSYTRPEKVTFISWIMCFTIGSPPMLVSCYWTSSSVT